MKTPMRSTIDPCALVLPARGTDSRRVAYHLDHAEFPAARDQLTCVGGHEDVAGDSGGADPRPVQAVVAVGEASLISFLLQRTRMLALPTWTVGFRRAGRW